MIDLAQNIAITMIAIVMIYYYWQFNRRKDDIRTLYGNDKMLQDFSNNLAVKLEKFEKHQVAVVDAALDIIERDMKEESNGE